MFNQMNRKLLLCIGLFLILLNSNGYAVVSQFNVTLLDNPAPGYLRFTFPPSLIFFLTDNTGDLIYETETKATSNDYILLKNGNWAQRNGEKYYIYNENLFAIDSILNPTISWSNPYLVDWHDFIQLSNGHYLMILMEHRTVDLSEIVEGGKTNALINSSVIIETDRSGTIYWQWKSLDHLDILDATEDIDLTQNTIDLTHINSLFEDSDGNILISIRHYDEISKINKSTGDFIWRFGGSKCKNNQFTINNDNQNGFVGFSHQHSITKLDNGNILLYDNGNLKTPLYSRAVEYQMDYTNKIATKVWEGTHSPGFFQASMGSAVRLPNGNTLINWGRYDITEMRPNNQIVFNLRYSESDDISVYKAYRVVSQMKATSKNITSSGVYSFDTEGETGVSINVTNLSGSGKSSIEKHFYLPQNCHFTDSTFTSILPYRWVLNYNDIFSLNGTFKINASSISGLVNPAKASIYKRNKEGVDYFQEILTTYNSNTNELSASFSGGGEFVIGITNLESPELLTPNKQDIVPSSGIASWTKQMGAEMYQIQFCDNSNFLQLKINSFIQDSATYTFENLDFSTKYFWRVRAINSKDTSDWSEASYFNTILAKPDLISPENNANSVRLNTPLKWNKVPNSTKYRLQISKSKFFTEILFDISDIVTTEINSLNFINNSNYYWRVMAYNNEGNASDWSVIWAFRTILETPALIYPKNDEINIPIPFSVKWNNVNGTMSYLVQISTKSDFSEVNIEEQVDFTQIDIDNFDFDTKYFWRVRAIRSSDSSDWSEVNNFQTKLHRVSLFYPENQTLNIPINCTFRWEESNPEALYCLQLSLNSDFTNLVHDLKSVSEPKFIIKDLKINTKYYWRVKTVLNEKESDWTPYFYFITTKERLMAAPKLISPKDNSESYIKGTLSWNSVENASSYRIQISQNSTFGSLVKDTIVSSVPSYNYLKLNPDSRYYWRIKAFNYADSSDWSSVWSFKVTKLSETVILLQPLNDELQVPLKGTLEWEPIPSAIGYEVQLSSSPSFQELQIKDIIYSKVIVEFSNLELNSTYYWKVRFIREYDTSAWSSVWSFNTFTSSVLSMPKLLSPINGLIPAELTGDLKWEHSTNADRYFVQISKSSTFDSILIKTTVDAHLYNFSNLAFNTQYFWRIAAVNDTSKSNWSNIYRFTTELGAPTIQYPADNAESVPVDCEITWNVDEDISYYSIQIASDPEFKSILVDYNKIYNLKFAISLDENTIYYCRVKATTDDNFSKWSKIVRFRTYDPNSIKEGIISGSLVYPNPVSTSFSLYPIPEGALSYEILDNLGTKRGEGLLGNEIEVTFLPSGIYFLKLNNSLRPLKFIKL